MHNLGTILRALSKFLGAHAHHVLPLLGESVVRQTAVDNAFGVVNFAVAHQVNRNRGLSSHSLSFSDFRRYPKIYCEVSG